MDSARKIYFVRHGLTQCNVEERIQTPDDPLTEIGLSQAKQLAHRFSRIPFDTLVCSDFFRTKQTANEIAAKTQHEVIGSSLFREWMHPASLIGKVLNDPDVLQFDELRREHTGDITWRYEQEETRQELHERARAAFEFAAQQPGDVVVVTHGLFLRYVLLAQLLPAEALSQFEGYIRKRLLTNNTGITVFEYRNELWRLLTWNDHAHLG